jgi:Uma2 family endonuclease
MPAGGENMATVSPMDDIHRITVDEYERLALAGEWERTELIDGVVYDMSPQLLLHGRTNAHVYNLVRQLFPDDEVLIGVTVRLSDFSAVDPDVLVIDSSAPFDEKRFVPAEAVKLVVEVSVSTQAKDLSSKLRVYAAAGMPQYWVVDPRPEAGILLRHTEPRGEHYTNVRRYDVGEGATGLDAAAVLAGR